MFRGGQCLAEGAMKEGVSGRGGQEGYGQNYLPW